MARFVDRRTFLRRGAVAGLGILGAPLLGPSRASGAGDRLVVAVGQWGIETPVCLAHQPVREVPLGPDVRFADHARSQDLHVPSGARHRVEALERDADVDVQAALGRGLSRGVGRDDGRGREVHRRAELEAGRAGRHGALLARQSRPDRDARQAHGRDAFQDAPVGRAVAVQPVRGLPEHHLEEVPRVGGRGEGLLPSDRHRALPPRRGQARRLPSLRGRAEPLAQDARFQGARDPPASRIPPRGRRASARARSTSGRCSATISTRRRRRACASTTRRTPPPTG